MFELLQLGEVLSVPTTKPLTEERVWSVFRDALLGLEYCEYNLNGNTSSLLFSKRLLPFFPSPTTSQSIVLFFEFSEHDMNFVVYKYFQ